jgi:RHH-type proline utilization regulon transcriptional repressor/proline dehydrogenase/delta 1-pyrroline-5-carboxylate dehydrogenase
MRTLRLGNPWDLATDIGPLIDAEAHASIHAYVDTARDQGRVMLELPAPEQGFFVGPTLVRINGIEDLGGREIFGPVLHVATFGSADLPKVMTAINATGYGLTFGLHSRIDDRVQEVAEVVEAGNIYVNRNQIGAVVGSQPFGGEGLSGTGPKAGGPNYLARFRRSAPPAAGAWSSGTPVPNVQRALDSAPAAPPPAALDLPGPTGEMNRLSLHPRAPLLCLGPGAETAAAQGAAIRALGGCAVILSGELPPEALLTLSGFSGALWWGDVGKGRAYAQALADRRGPILPLITSVPDRAHAHHERHLCVDTTASGGNAALLAEVAGG